MILFSAVCNQNSKIAWKSKLHADGTMFGEYFIAGIDTPQGQFTYHYRIEFWDLFRIPELEKAPAWDGHLPSDVGRLLSIKGVIND
jgi:hypothetical protein